TPSKSVRISSPMARRAPWSPHNRQRELSTLSNQTAPAPIQPNLWKRAPTLFVLVCLLITTGFQIRAQSGEEKLATVLQDVARAGEPAGGDATVRPKSVQDAVASRRLRFDAAGNVQVYVLVTATTDDQVQSLVAAGATVEAVDTEQRRVQARVPISRL